MIRLKTKELIAERYDETPNTLDFAHELGVSMPTAYSILKGEIRTSITIDLLNKLCHMLDAQPGEILEHIPDEGGR